MVRLRISGPARSDLVRILATNLERWGEAGQARYAALLATAMRAVARHPLGPTTRDRTELSPGVRSVPVRHTRGARTVRDPAHVVFYRVTSTAIEIMRVLHERMEPALHIAATRPRGRRR